MLIYSNTYRYIMQDLPDNVSQDMLNHMASMGNGNNSDVSYGSEPIQMSPLQVLVNSPSIPLELKKKFFVLWEESKLGNYEGDDMELLMYMFDEWAMLLRWNIPEQRWGNITVYKDTPHDPVKIPMDLTLLISTLRQIYYINLTKGREGFMVKEMNTQRAFSSSREEQVAQDKRKMKLF